MSAHLDPTATAAAVWNSTVKSGDPVLYWPNGNRDGAPEIDAVCRDAFVMRGGPYVLADPAPRFAAVYLFRNYQPIPVGHVERHPLADQIRALGKPEDRELEFPPPDCPWCDVPCESDADGFTCSQCHAAWGTNGHLGGSTRRCVENSDHEAQVTGEDEQPRCITCQTTVLAGEIEATEPYGCRRCREHVVGMPADLPAAAAQLCGRCHESDEQQTRIDAYLAQRGVGRASA
ncbi:hypothetical protein ACIA8K_06860 [Catenuloplanes sp. NPDC051500]|uniref:hypothetical protein n=1 Tax=Catenuloplanes sp. NPDC051500 TaxID=3363959 RepID=UPI0037958F4D